MTPLLPALLSAALASAGDNFCPKPPDNADLIVNEVYNQVRLGSTFAGRMLMNDKPVWFPQPKMTTDRSGARVPQRDNAGNMVMGQIPEVFKGAGALAFAPNIGLNKGNNKPVVAVTTELFDLAHTRCEWAFVMAHEFAHLEKDHPDKLDKEILRLFTQWSDAKPITYWENIPNGKAALDFRKEKGAELAKFQSPMEDEADARGFELVTKATDECGLPCDKSAGSKMLQHAHEWMEAYLTKQEKEAMAKGPQDHRPPIERAKTLEEFYRQQSLGADWYK